jgi:hypothetical protein
MLGAIGLRLSSRGSGDRGRCRGAHRRRGEMQSRRSASGMTSLIGSGLIAGAQCRIFSGSLGLGGSRGHRQWALQWRDEVIVRVRRRCGRFDRRATQRQIRGAGGAGGSGWVPSSNTSGGRSLRRRCGREGPRLFDSYHHHRFRHGSFSSREAVVGFGMCLRVALPSSPHWTTLGYVFYLLVLRSATCQLSLGRVGMQ